MAFDSPPPFVCEAFARFDADNSGLLEPQELPDALSECALFIDDATQRAIVTAYSNRPQPGLSVDEFAVLVTDLPT